MKNVWCADWIIMWSHIYPNTLQPGCLMRRQVSISSSRWTHWIQYFSMLVGLQRSSAILMRYISVTYNTRMSSPLVLVQIQKCVPFLQVHKDPDSYNVLHVYMLWVILEFEVSSKWISWLESVPVVVTHSVDRFLWMSASWRCNLLSGLKKVLDYIFNLLPAPCLTNINCPHWIPFLEWVQFLILPCFVYYFTNSHLFTAFMPHAEFAFSYVSPSCIFNPILGMLSWT